MCNKNQLMYEFYPTPMYGKCPKQFGCGVGVKTLFVKTQAYFMRHRLHLNIFSFCYFVSFKYIVNSSMLTCLMKMCMNHMCRVKNNKSCVKGINCYGLFQINTRSLLRCMEFLSSFVYYYCDHLCKQVLQLLNC